jgi:hypothetical protein
MTVPEWIQRHRLSVHYYIYVDYLLAVRRIFRRYIKRKECKTY